MRTTDDMDGSDEASTLLQQEASNFLQQEAASWDAATPPLIMVLVGRCGAGKSSTANALLGEQCFRSSRSVAAVTSTCQLETTLLDGREICLVDTPGLGDPDTPHATHIAEIIRGVSDANQRYGSRANVALLFVMSAAGRLEEADLEAFNSLGMAFGPRLYDRALALFTHGDLLERASPAGAHPAAADLEGGLEPRSIDPLACYLAGAGAEVDSFLTGLAGGAPMLISNPCGGAAAGPVATERLAAVVTKALAVAGPPGSLRPPRPSRKVARRERQHAAAVEAAEAGDLPERTCVQVLVHHYVALALWWMGKGPPPFGIGTRDADGEGGAGAAKAR